MIYTGHHTQEDSQFSMYSHLPLRKYMMLTSNNSMADIQIWTYIIFHYSSRALMHMLAEIKNKHFMMMDGGLLWGNERLQKFLSWINRFQRVENAVELITQRVCFLSDDAVYFLYSLQ